MDRRVAPIRALQTTCEDNAAPANVIITCGQMKRGGNVAGHATDAGARPQIAAVAGRAAAGRVIGQAEIESVQRELQVRIWIGRRTSVSPS